MKKIKTKNAGSLLHFYLAPQVGFEPTAYRLTAERSTTELLGNIKLFFLWCARLLTDLSV